MRHLPLEPVARLSRALFPSQDSQFGWRLASVTVSLVSVGLIALTVGYRIRGAELPPALWVGLLASFATVVVLFSKFLFWAQQEGGQFQGAFTTTERKFQSVVENALDAILILDDEAICREANPAAESLFGTERAALIGRPIGPLYKNFEQFRANWQTLLSRKFQQGDAELIREASSPVFVEYTAKADCLPGQHVMILRDVTERRRAEMSLLESEEALRKATLSLTQDLRMDFIMETLLKSLEELVPYTCARVLVPESGPHMLALGERTCPEPPTKPERRSTLTFVAEESTFFHRILTEQKSVLIADTKTEEKWRTFKGHRHLRSWLSAPLVASGEYLGCLSVGHTQPNLYTPDHLRRAELLAIPAAAAIQNARLYETACIYGETLESRIAELKRTETALARSEDSRRSFEEKFERVFESCPLPFSITTLKEGRFLDVNAAFEHRYGYSRNEILGRTVQELRIWEDPTDRGLMLARLNQGAPIRNMMTRLRTKSGQIKLTAYSASKIQFEGETCILAISEDVHQDDSRKSN